MAGLAAEKRWPLERYEAACNEAIENGFILYDEKYQVIFVAQHLKYNPPKSPNVIRGWGKVYNEIPNCELKKECYRTLKAICQDQGDKFLEMFYLGFGKDSETPGARSPGDLDPGVVETRGQVYRIQKPEPKPRCFSSEKPDGAGPVETSGHFSTRLESEGADKEVPVILGLCSELEVKSRRNGKRFNGYTFVQQKVNEGGAHPGAVIDALKGVNDNWDTIRAGPWPYANHIYAVRNPHYHEAEFIMEAQDLSRQWDVFLRSKEGEKIKALIGKSLAMPP
jgi:hypothetical protein